MSSPEIPISMSGAADATPGITEARPGFWGRLGSRVEWIGERLNPLLVKEVRQSLKSRQFSITFTAVLCLSWLWSIGRIVQLGPQVSYGAFGPELFLGYYVILAFPLILIVPYSAYRSLIAEREDNTYELVAITTLKPRQIIAGKLGSAVAQMAVYFSAVAPCLAFTYLLRGIDVPTIFFIMFYTFLASLGFSLCALLLASIAKEKHWQVMLAVLIIVGLFFSFTNGVQLVFHLLRTSRLPFGSSEFWVLNAVYLSFYLTTFAMFYLAAAAQLTFTAENRSTPLRWAMLAQQTVYVGWIGFLLCFLLTQSRGARNGIGLNSVLATVFAVAYWFLMGSFMIGEVSELSPRVKRRLPVSTFGRAFRTLLNPGPGTGYLFAVSNMLAMAILAIIAVLIAETSKSAPITGLPSMEVQISAELLLVGYLTFYLGVSNLLLRLLRKFTQVNLATSVLVTVLLVMAGWGIPAMADSHYFQNGGYNLGHVTDPFFSCAAILDSRAAVFFNELMVIVLGSAAAVFLFNLVYIVPEIRQHRILPPPRVAEEDQAVTAALHTPKPEPSSPWD